MCTELDKKVISLYAKGMSAIDIQAEIEDLYGITISPSMVSRITDKVMEGAVEWQNRVLDKIYPIVYLDAMYFMDGLKGLSEAIKTVFPSVNIQTCIVHQIRNSIKYIASKDKKEFMCDLKSVYKASTEELALA